MNGYETHCAYIFDHYRASSKIMGVYPFNSEAKSMTTVIQMRECNVVSATRNEYRVYTKGIV